MNSLICEERSIREWKEPLPKLMSLEDFIGILSHGLTTCPESWDCDSRSAFGKDSCMCIRSVFPHEIYYELYKELRPIYELYDLERVIWRITKDEKGRYFKKGV